MKNKSSRRQFLADISQGTLIATIGPVLAAELGITTTYAEPAPEPLNFGEIEPLVCLMQETEAAKLQPLLLKQLKSGVPLKRLLAAGALANARTFGGEDYVGFHTLMAMMPALRMSDSMPSAEQALPVFKVLYRNTSRIQENGGRKAEVLHPIAAGTGIATADQLHDAMKRKDNAAAEQIFANLLKQGADGAFDASAV